MTDHLTDLRPGGSRHCVGHGPPEHTRHHDPGPPRARSPGPVRWVAGVRLLLLAAVAVAVVGIAGHAVGAVWLTTTLGPTAYLLLAHPDSEAARLRSSILGHAAGAACGLASLAAFGLWRDPSVAETQHDTWAQIAAQAIAVGVPCCCSPCCARTTHPPRRPLY